jgi:hypothetical protein
MSREFVRIINRGSVVIDLLRSDFLHSPDTEEKMGV